MTESDDRRATGTLRADSRGICYGTERLGKRLRHVAVYNKKHTWSSIPGMELLKPLKSPRGRAINVSLVLLMR